MSGSGFFDTAVSAGSTTYTNIQAALDKLGGPVQFPVYAVTGQPALPDPAAHLNCYVHVSGSATKNHLAYSDGAAWRWENGGAIVS